MFDLTAIQGLQLHSSHGNGGHWWSFLLFAGANNAQSSLFPFFFIFPMYNVLVRLSFANSQSASLFSDPGAFAVCVSVSVSDRVLWWRNNLQAVRITFMRQFVGQLATFGPGNPHLPHALWSLIRLQLASPFLVTCPFCLHAALRGFHSV